MKKYSTKIMHLAIVVCVFITIPSYAQKNQTKLSGYWDNDIWMVQKKGNRGIKSDEGKIIVPVKYDLALPSVYPEFSFIVKDGNLGLYNNIGNVEVVMQTGYSEMDLFVNEDHKTILVFTKTNNSKEAFELKRSAEGIIELTKLPIPELEYPEEIMQDNGLKKLDSDHYVHKFSNVKLEINEDYIEEEIYDVLVKETFQKTGVFSVAQGKFIIPAEYLSIAFLTRKGLFYQTIKGGLIRTTQLDNNIFDSTAVDFKTKLNYGDVTFLSGLYTSDYISLIDPQPIHISPTNNGGYYTISKDSLKVFDKEGEFVFLVPQLPKEFDSFEAIGGKFYLAAYTDWEINDEMESEFKNYFIYDTNGSLLAIENMNVEFSTGNKYEKVVMVQNPEDEWDFYYGIFDFEKRDFVLDPVYKSINKVYFKDDIIKCETKKCSYYLKAEKEGDKEYYYLDQNLSPFTPQTALLEEVIKYLDYEPRFSSRDKTRVYQLDSEMADYIPLSINTNAITLKVEDPIALALSDDGIEAYNAYSKKYRNLEIVIAYAKEDIEGATPFFGLKYINQNHFLLRPVFSDMKFNTTKNTLDFRYKNETGSILLERYE